MYVRLSLDIVALGLLTFVPVGYSSLFIVLKLCPWLSIPPNRHLRPWERDIHFLEVGGLSESIDL